MTNDTDPFDDLAALYLTEAGVEPDAPPAATASIELVLAGHLPVRGGLWLAPYADSLARGVGTTTLVRLDHDAPIVQMFRGPIDLDRPDELGSWRDVLERMAPWTCRWIVRPPHESTPDQLLEAGADRITILSGADDAARVAAYDLIRKLVNATERLSRALPPLGIVIIGARDEAAGLMIDNLNRTARTFLGLEVPLIATLQRMDADLRLTADVHLAAESCPPLGESVTAIADAARRAGDVRRAPDPLPSREPGPAEPPWPHEAAPYADVPRETEPEPVPPSEPAVVLPPAGSAAAYVAAGGVSRRVPMKLAPKATWSMEPKMITSSREPDTNGLPVPLSRNVEGLEHLEVRMPGHERVELALGSDGRLHLLAREEDLRDLHVVREWAWAHRDLIGMAVPRARVQGGRDVVPHLFTAEPARVTDLYGGELQLHVLAPVRVEGRTGWYAAPLNTPVARA